MLDFRPVTINAQKKLVPHLNKYGSGSCQHSFVQMLGLFEKYGDSYCFCDDVLFIKRSRKCTAKKNVYLAPLGNLGDNPRHYIDTLLDDAHERGVKASFETITEEFANTLQIFYPEVFALSKERDLAEYIYSSHSLVELPGRKLAAKRNRINAFYAAYSPDDICIEQINSDNLEDVKLFQAKWLADRNSYEADERLDIENRAIELYLNNFEALDFVGTVIYVNGKVAGYAAGVPLSDDCIDEIIEKGDRDIIGIYQLVCREFARLVSDKYAYINREEDIGIAGLRQAKESYLPDRLLVKYIATEI